MYALHVTFTTDLPDDALRPAQRAFADRLASVPGFVSKTWLRDGAVHGGFYLFATAADARAYLDGPLFAGLRGFDDLAVSGYAVDTETTVPV